MVDRRWVGATAPKTEGCWFRRGGGVGVSGGGSFASRDSTLGKKKNTCMQGLRADWRRERERERESGSLASHAYRAKGREKLSPAPLFQPFHGHEYYGQLGSSVVAVDVEDVEEASRARKARKGGSGRGGRIFGGIADGLFGRRIAEDRRRKGTICLK